MPAPRRSLPISARRMARGLPIAWTVLAIGALLVPSLSVLSAPAATLSAAPRASNHLEGSSTAAALAPSHVPAPARSVHPATVSSALGRASVTGAPRPGNWTPITSSTLTPPTTQSGGMIYDPLTGEYVLFGGSSGGSALNETWTYKGGQWTDLGATLTTAPSARWYFSFVWDAADQYGLLFGGRDTTTDFNDTWAFNGTAWAQITTSTSPPPITTGRTVYDAADGYVWLYGGYSIMPTGPSMFNFTWTYTAGVWTNVTSTVAGAPGDPHVVTYAVYDSTDGYVLMYGGGTAASNTTCSLTGNTWTYLNGTYHDLTSSISSAPPVSLGSRMMANDPAVGGVVLFGGWDGGLCGLSNQTWVYRGGSWYDQALAYNPGALWDGETAGDGPAGSALLFSGNTIIGTYSQSSATWNYTPALILSVGGTPRLGIVPFTVNLTSTVLGVGPFSYNWTWGDGPKGNATANASHTYTTVGSYTVRLTVTDSLGKVNATRIGVGVFASLAATPVASPTAGDAVLHAHFTSNVVGGVPPIGYLWRFGDGTISTLQNATHLYATAGNFTWTLNVTDAQGHLNRSSGSVQVWPALQAPTFTQNQTRVITPGSVAFSATPVGGRGPYAILWSFGDGSPTSNGNATSHVYSTSGTFTGNVTVTDFYGERWTRVFSEAVAVPLVAQALATPTIGVVPLTVQFGGIASGGFPPYNYSWSYGTAAAPATGSNVVYTYTAPGHYTPVLRITDSDGHQFVSQLSVKVVSALAVALSGSERIAVTGTPVTFAVSTTGGAGPFDFAWGFGDGTAVTGSGNETHTYHGSGTFRVTVGVTDQLSEVQSTSLSLEVVTPLAVTVGTNLTSVTVGQSVELMAAVVGGAVPETTNWTGLPPGCPPSPHQLQFSCTPTMVGTFEVDVWVNDSAGQTRFANTTLVVTPVPSGGGSSLAGPFPNVDLVFLVPIAVAVAAIALWAVRRRPPAVEPPPTPGATPAEWGEGAPPGPG